MTRRSWAPGLLDRVAQKETHDTGCETPANHDCTNDQRGGAHEPNGKEAMIEKELRDFDEDNGDGVK